MIPRPPEQCHKLKLIWEKNNNKAVAVSPRVLFLDTTDRSYIWKRKPWSVRLTTHLQGQQDSLKLKLFNVTRGPMVPVLSGGPFHSYFQLINSVFACPYSY